MNRTTKKHLMRYKITALLFIATVIACTSQLTATIIRTESFATFFMACEDFTEKSLVIFDVDRVLIEPRDAIMRAPNQRMLWELRHKYGAHLSSAQMADISSIVNLNESSSLVDPLALAFINHIQQRNIPIIGLTATGTGGFGKIASIPDWRIADLARFGISFATSFQQQPPFVLTQLNERGTSPVFKSGILFTGGYSKGDVLEVFLDTVGFTPDKVLFADDLFYNLISVENALANMGVKHVIAYHYLGADKIPNTIDPEVAEFQIKTLLEKEQWLSDQEAKTDIPSQKLSQMQPSLESLR